MSNHQFAVVFPGQGSQSLHMLADVAASFPEIEQTFADASAALGYDLWEVTQVGPAEKLDQTIYTQPALLAASYAIWRLLSKKTGFTPTALAGHSLGEYTALVCANALAFTDAIQLVAARGHFMQEAVASGEGAMAAIVGLDNEAVSLLCEQAKENQQEVIAPANFNSIGQVVIAGHKAPVERAILLAKEQGAKLAMLIPVSVPSHCDLMQPAAKRLAALLADISFKAPSIPVINNVEVVPYTTAESIRDGLVKQLYKPVRWVDTIQAFAASGITQIIECGPGKVLTGLNKRIDKNLTLLTTSSVENLAQVVTA